ncbi:HAMP domain-containing sensor histidine kinase [Parabacteroides sp. PF5-6]|uniref:sensor histidine kinase n=1 Tax=Parabacteroides sp. PF5-6 TaxID=1742403 RepID=UPI0024062C48|nr:HAMP domain-containing sensor histidine kinase [Parabacteroides sp. PF5-6]MDF9830227.1 two-component system, sporulation sensor kinase D [Parabacteroides sp. PF5-6]
MNIYDSKQRFKLGFIVVAMVIAVVSMAVTNSLTKDLAREELQKMQIWADAQRVTASEGEGDYLMLILTILEGNQTIPVILSGANDSIIYYNNIELPEHDSEAFLKAKLQKLKLKNPPILLDLGGDLIQYIYYDDSTILKRLSFFPYVQLGVLFVFILIAFLALSSTQKAEQNKVWVGLSKETAHQLGTPISSLMAWVEYLRLKEIDPSLLNEIEKDVNRLEMVADRFSKIGSNPDPKPVDIVQSIHTALEYLGSRISSKVTIHTEELSAGPIWVRMNDSLFSWVIENLVKNAVDAMEGKGEISFRIETGRRTVKIDITDTGKGIPKSKFKSVFSPGYTTKARGWGLGLSLVKRIVESYNNGKIYVKHSELGRGTTFRIELPLNSNYEL